MNIIKENRWIVLVGLGLFVYWASQQQPALNLTSPGQLTQGPNPLAGMNLNA